MGKILPATLVLALGSGTGCVGPGVVVEKDYFICCKAMGFHPDGVHQVLQWSALSVVPLSRALTMRLHRASQNAVSSTFPEDCLQGLELLWCMPYDFVFI
jgi:hypothetical protein